jgi:hypothetical protein
MANPIRIDAQDARKKVRAGALLVCAYDDEQKCRDLQVDEAISLSAFRSRLPSLPKTQEIVFVCA